MPNKFNDPIDSDTLAPPSQRMVQPYWLVDREHRREAIVVDGNDAWALFCACADGDHESVNRLVSANRDLIYAQIWYQQPIDLAIREGHLAVVKTLVEADEVRRLEPRVHEQSTYRVGLQEVERRGFPELSGWLREHKQGLAPRVDAKVDELKERITDGWEQITEAIGSQPTLLTATDEEGQTFLHLAVQQQNFMLLTALIELGAKIDSVTINGRSALDYATRYFPPAIPYLLKHGAEPTIGALVVSNRIEDLRKMLGRDRGLANVLDSFGERPLAKSAKHRRHEAVKLLLEHDADPNLPGPNHADGYALYIATEKWDRTTMGLLLEAGANPNAEIDSSGCCLSTLVDHQKWGNGPARRAHDLLTEYGAFDPPWAMSAQQQLEFLKSEPPERILTRFDSGWSDFHHHLCSVEALDLYVDRVGNELIKSFSWNTLLFDIRDVEYARRLVHHGMDVNRRDWLGRTQLHAIASSGDVERAKLLVELGAEIDPIDVEWSATPLGYAARKGHIEMVKYLLNQGADKALPSGREWAQPIAYATLSGTDEMTELLR